MWGLNSQLSDPEGLGGKLSQSDKSAIRESIREASEWVDANGYTTTSDELESRLAEIQGVVSPITSRLYQSEPTSASHTEL